MPDATSASAVSRISSSSMLQPKLFQLFQPIGGVGARLPIDESAAAAWAGAVGGEAVDAAVAGMVAADAASRPPAHTAARMVRMVSPPLVWCDWFSATKISANVQKVQYFDHI